MTGPNLVYGEVYGCRLNVLPGVGSMSPWSSWPGRSIFSKGSAQGLPISLSPFLAGRGSRFPLLSLAGPHRRPSLPLLTYPMFPGHACDMSAWITLHVIR